MDLWLIVAICAALFYHLAVSDNQNEIRNKLQRKSEWDCRKILLL